MRYASMMMRGRLLALACVLVAGACGGSEDFTVANSDDASVDATMLGNDAASVTDASNDAGTDAGKRVDSGAIDAGAIDAGGFDAGAIDAGAIDAGAIDAGAIDAGAVDAGAIDAGDVDSGDAGSARDAEVDAQGTCVTQSDCPTGESCCTISSPSHCYPSACLSCCMGGPIDAGLPPDAGACSPGCAPGMTCCGGTCVNEGNDILNCGGCGKTCGGVHPYCDNGNCASPPCSGIACPVSEFCCDTQCCAPGMLCCHVPSNIPTTPTCVAPVNGTCPAGCPLCP
jgi:hypothetical protein